MNALALVRRCYSSDDIVSRFVLCPIYSFTIYVEMLGGKDSILYREGDAKSKVGLAMFIGFLFLKFNGVCGPEKLFNMHL